MSGTLDVGIQGISGILDISGFEFIGFEPTPALETFAKSRFGQIDGEAPSDSSARAQIQKTLDGFLAIAKIQSSVGTFVAETFAEDPHKAITALSRRIRSQLRLWKRSRFSI